MPSPSPFDTLGWFPASELSHEEISWQLADTMEELPFYTYLLNEEALTDTDINWATQIINERETTNLL